MSHAKTFVCNRNSRSWSFAIALVTLFVSCSFAQAPKQPASGAQTIEKTAAEPVTPPMGWNSWDSFGTTVSEADIRANAEWMHDHLQKFGWQYVSVDMEWYTANPTPAGNGGRQQRLVDGFGRFIPVPARFPSADGGKGFAPLAAFVHSLGLKFGIHILQGIPREAMRDDLPIEGSNWHAHDAGNPEGTCGWNPDYVDVRPNPAGQAYYDSIARLYAQWGVDLIKVDCIAAPRFKDQELAMLRAALDKTGRVIALSTSPGEPPIEHAPELQANAQTWRISNDVWDLWHSGAAYPQGLGDQFARTAYWNRTRRAGHWPDADMLPLGELSPAPGFGKPRKSRLTPDEQQTMLTLWCMFRSPLMMGGNLPLTDPATLRLLTNSEVLAVDQHSRNNIAALQRPDAAVWTAQPEEDDGYFVAIFNLKDSERELSFGFDELGIPAGVYKARDLWHHSSLGELTTFRFQVPAHGSVLLRLSALSGTPARKP